MARFILNTMFGGGDLVPLVRMGKMLRRAGHTVVLVTHAVAERVARESGFVFEPVDTVDEFERTMEESLALSSPTTAVAFYRDHVLSRVKREIEAVGRHHSPDAVIMGRSSTSLGVRLASEKYRIPFVSLYLSPAFVSALSATGELLDRLSDEMNRLREDAGLPRTHDWHAWLASGAALGTWPSWFAEPTAGNNGSEIALMGFLLGTKTGGVPRAVEEALSGDGTVLITGGSERYMPPEYFASAIEGCRLLGKRSIVVAPPRAASLLPNPLPSSCTHISEYVEFADLFPRVSGVVHHGGIATCGEALAAGIPQLAMGAWMDRPDNAAHLQKLGVGEYLPPAKWSGAVVAESLSRLLDDDGVRSRCASWAARALSDEPERVLLACAARVSSTEGREGLVVQAARAPRPEALAGAAARTAEISRRVGALPPLHQTVLASMLAKPRSQSSITRVERDGRPLPLSSVQERLWFLWKLDPVSPAYNLAVGWSIRGVLDVGALQAALREVVRRHEILRTTYVLVDEVPMQRIHAEIAVPFEDDDVLCEASREAIELAARERLRQAAALPFDLDRDPPLRVTLARLADDEHLLGLTVHHIAIDGWGFAPFFRELSTLYAAYTRGAASPLPGLPVQYADYAAWQRSQAREAESARLVAYWLAELEGAPPHLDLPTDRPRPPVQEHRGATLKVTLGRELTAAVDRFARAAGATPFMVLLASWVAVLARYSGQDDIVVGTPVANRSHPELDASIGCFVNTLAVRARLADDPTFQELVGRIKQTTLRAYDHQNLPFEQLVERLAPARDLSRAAVFQVMFVIDNFPKAAVVLHGLDATAITVEEATAKFDLTLYARERQAGIELAMTYDSALFDRTRVVAMLGHIERFLSAALREPDRRVRDLPVLTARERQRSVVEWNSAASTASEESILGAFRANVERKPNESAVVGGGRTLTYAELDVLSSALAAELIAAGVVPGALVGIASAPGLELPVAIFGIWKAGAAYVPLDPKLPIARLRAIAQNVVAVARSAEVELDIVQPTVEIRVDVATVRPVANGGRMTVAPSSPAYVLFTSGSTGEPKGVVVEHQNLASYVRAVTSQLDLPVGSYAIASTFSADLGNTTLFPPFVLGGTLHVLDEDTRRDGALFSAHMERHGVDVLKIVPSHFFALARGQGAFPRKRLIFGGEAAQLGDIRDLLTTRPPGCRVFNHYGPTETTVGVLTFDMDRLSSHELATVPLGRPLPGCRAYVLDGSGHPAPVGVFGELHVGGAQVARGYLADPEKTALRFVGDPFSSEPAARMYRTGDRARWLESGDIEFGGRFDDQVKVRGFRVELGDVTAAVRSCSSVHDAVVVPHGAVGNNLALVAYVVPEAESTFDAETLRAELVSKLPEYMVPSALVRLDAIPLTANGKVDRRKLPEPVMEHARPEPVAPRTPLEEEMAQIWASVLQLPRVGVHDDFFEIGGHSLLAMQLVTRIRNVLNVELSLRGLFKGPTIAKIVEAIENTRGTVHAPPIVRTDVPAGSVLSFWQESVVAWEKRRAPSVTWAKTIRISLRGSLDTSALREALTDLVERQEVLRQLLGGQSPPHACPAADIPMGTVDLRRATEEEVRRVVHERHGGPLSPDGGPLFKTDLLRVSDDEHVLHVSWHYLVHDATGIDLIVHEILEGYASRIEGRASLLPELRVRYVDYAAWERSWFAGEGRVEVEAAKRQLHGVSPLELPTDRAPVAGAPPGTGAQTATFKLDVSESERFAGLCQGAGVTPFMGAFAVVSLFLARWCKSDEVIVVAPVNTRARPEVSSLAGRFSNWIPLRLRVDGAMTVRDLLHAARRSATEAYSAATVPASLVYDDVDVFGHPFSRVALNMPGAGPPSSASQIDVRSLRVHVSSAPKEHTCRTDLSIMLGSDRGCLGGQFAGRADLFDLATIARCAESIADTFHAIKLETRVSELR